MPARLQGFTLVEMLLLVIVVGTLAAVVLPLVLTRTSAGRSRSRSQAAKAQMYQFKNALDMFKEDNGYYPHGTNGLDDLVKQPKQAPNWHQYLDSIPLDPWGNKYLYEFPSRHLHGGYDLASMGADGKPGSTDDITNWQPSR